MEHVIDLYRQKSKVYTDAIDKVVVSMILKKKENGDNVFMICGCEPGSGSTSVAINMAISFALSGQRTLLIDCDMRKDIAHKRLNVGESFGLVDYLLGEESNIIYPTTLKLLQFIPSGECNEDAVRVLCSEKFDGFIKIMKEKFDFVIIDTVAANTVVDPAMISSKVDGTILVAMENRTLKNSIVEAQKTFANVNSKIMGIIVNRVDEDDYEKTVKYHDYFMKLNKKKQ
ncbi:MAG: CpsD/CapB family tyrosine-protein kinase [Lachnospiraceae bacterium]|nr:CpsD/CapB family tyrosine-protein kinase [Lachnospiraceae bacterium]